MQKDNGLKFELWIEQLFKELGYWDVKRNKLYYAKNFFGKRIRKCQIDVEFISFTGKHYVECKYRANSYVDFEEVQKFLGILKLLRIGSRKGIVATNSYFTPSAKQIASSSGLKLYDRKKLESLNFDRLNLFGIIKHYARKQSIEQLVNQQSF